MIGYYSPAFWRRMYNLHGKIGQTFEDYVNMLLSTQEIQSPNDKVDSTSRVCIML